MLKCPECKLTNPENAMYCDCGYEFPKHDNIKSIYEEKTTQKSKGLGIISVVIAISVLLIIIITIVVKKSNETGFLTIDGYDNEAKAMITSINLWNDYNNRLAGISTTIKNGEKVSLIRRDGNAVFVKTMNGKKGWISTDFIKELKEGKIYLDN